MLSVFFLFHTLSEFSEKTQGVWINNLRLESPWFRIIVCTAYS